jgi:carotenoid cleavage dioxygenase
MSLVHDAATDRSELVVLAAADPSAGPVARVLLPTRVPVGFHGNWVADPA